MLYVRKIKESSWFNGQESLDSDSISDISTTNHELSVWKVADDKSNLDNIILALALTRNDTNGFYFVFIDDKDLAKEYKWEISTNDQDGDTAYQAMKGEHKNFEIKNIWDQGFLAEHIYNLLQDENNYGYYDEPKLLSILSSAILDGKITEDDLKSNNKGKWLRAYKKNK